MDGAVEAINAFVIGTEYPYFDAEGLVSQADYVAKVDELQGYIAQFIARNGEREDYTATAEETLKVARELVAYDDAMDATAEAYNALTNANNALVEATGKLNEVPSYFNAEVTKDAYIALKADALAKKTAYLATLGASKVEEDAELTAAVVANAAEADYILAKEAIYEDYAAFAVAAKEGKDAAIQADIDTILNKAVIAIDAYTLEDLADTIKISVDFSVFKATINNTINPLAV